MSVFLLNPQQLFKPSAYDRLNRTPLQPLNTLLSPAQQNTYQMDQLQLQQGQKPPMMFQDLNDEDLPANMVQEGFVTKLLFALKSPLVLFKSSDPNQIIDTGYKDTNGNAIRLTREAAAGFNKIKQIAASRGITVKVNSSYRTIEKQDYLWKQALRKYGSASAASKWVAPPGKSRHNYGKAIDMFLYKNGKKVSQAEFDSLIAMAGMYRPMSWEGWHIEPLSTKHERKSHRH